MNVTEVLAAVAQIGASLTIRGDRLLLSAPDKTRITDELRQGIQQNKPALLALLCSHSPDCHHTDAEIIDEFQRTGRIRLEYKNSTVWLVTKLECAAVLDNGTVYTLEEWTRLTSLSSDEIRQLHSLRTVGGPGGSLEVNREA